VIGAVLVGALVTIGQQATPLEGQCGARCTFGGASGGVRVAAPVLAEPNMRIDGLLNEPEWERASLLNGFTQYHPVEGGRASQQTEVLVFRSGDDLYFGIRAHDDSPAEIRATLADRDNVATSDDFVRIVLDTFADRRRAYAFTVNPLGIQQDGIWNEGTSTGGGGLGSDPVDDNQDFLWESSGGIRPWGYEVEVRIPFKSVRFPNSEIQTWGLQVLRTIQRDGYRESWAPLTGESANRLAQSGSLEDMQGLDPGLFLELNPFVTGSRAGAYDASAQAFDHSRPEMQLGMNATYGITSNLTLDATYNPDFSQVEADAGQIAVNERFALFFPEKRPFFLEGTELFELPARLVYTRSIVDPLVGAKVTGKVGGLNLGFLGALDEPGNDQDVVNLLRARADFGESSTVGMLYTDRTRDSRSYNRMLGGDLRLVLAQRYTLTLLSAGSVTGLGTSGRDTGALLRAGIDRAGRNFMYNVDLQTVSPAFEARSGLLDRVDDASLGGQIRYRWYGTAEQLLERVSPNLTVTGHWNHDDFWRGGGLEEWESQLGVGVGFRGNWGFNVNGTLNGFDFAPSDYEGLFVSNGGGGLLPFRPQQERFHRLLGLNGRLRLDNWQRVRGQIQIDWREAPLFQRTLGVPVEVAQSWTVDANFLVLPTQALQTEIGLRRTALDRKPGRERFARATIPRFRAQYQVNRALFLRAVLEYDSEEREALRDPESGNTLSLCGASCSVQAASDRNELYWELLLSLEPSPGTVFFLGYSRLADDRSRFALSDFTPQEDALFVKASYRFRL
jgi:hypothetical protein